MKHFLMPLCLALFSVTAMCQNFPYGKYDKAELEMKQYNNDTSAHAVVLREFGKAYVGNNNMYPIVYEYHVKIKIFDSRAFNQASVAIHIYSRPGNIKETVKNISGTTSYQDDKGNLRQIALKPENIYHQSIDKEDEIVKFTLPDLHNNCIIEYRYTTETTYRFNFHSWDFQSSIPKIYSEYETLVPSIFDYNTTLRGYLKLSKKEGTLEKDCFHAEDVNADCIKIIYAMNDIPAFVNEKYISSPRNYLSALYFELSATTNIDGVKKKYSFDWKDIEDILRKEERFAGQIKRRAIFKDLIPKLIYTLSDSLSKAQVIYAYLQKNFKFNNDYSKYSKDIKDAIDKHTGSVADINLSLVAALNVAGIKADPVILSTRENGIVSKVYPTLSSFDYVIARTNIGGKIYLLDATDPFLAFGMLPLRCINDKGRVISLDKPSYWIDLVADQKYKTTTTLDLSLLVNGKIRGSITNYSFGYAAYNKRKAIKKFNTADEYVENLDESLPKLKILKSDITNLDSLNLPLVENYDVEINSNDFDKETFAFTPAFWRQFTENPYKSNNRKYPLEIGSASDNKLILTMHYPNGYEIVEKPAAVGMAIPNKGGIFQTNFQFNPGIFVYSEVMQLDKPAYSPSEYPYVKELYNKIIQNQKANIVFKRKP